MGRYLAGRLGQSLILLLLVSLIGYSVLLLAPGGPMSQFALTPGISKAELDKIASQMGLDRPVIVQYADWLWHLLQGDWGRSFRDGQPVLNIIFGHLPATLLLMGTSTAIAIILGTFIGIRGAVKRYSLFDYAATVGAMVALSIPTFWFGLIAIYVFTLKLKWFPAGNMYTIGNGSVLDVAWHLVMPALVLALVDVAIWSRYMRTATLDVINQDFVRTARAKGVPEIIVALRHILRPVLTPVVTQLGLIMITIVNGAIFVELVFGLPGLGRLTVQALTNSDFPVILAITLIGSFLVMISNLLVDILYPLLDPRAHDSSRSR